MFEKWFKKEKKTEEKTSIETIPLNPPADIRYDLIMPVEVELKPIEEIKTEDFKSVEEIKLDEIKPAEEIKAIKLISDIVQDETQLSVQCEDTNEAECEELKIWDKLRETLKVNQNGLGLSAIQIGIFKRASLIRYPTPDGEMNEIRFINPKIIEKIGLVKFKGEGCLSFPGVYINTLRYSYIKVQDDINGETEYRGLLGIAVQHEIDHCNSELMFAHKTADTFKRAEPKIGRNDPCRCGSGKKYKKCCGK